MLPIVLVLAVFAGQQMTEQERQRNFDNWERCVNVKEADHFDAALMACDQLLQPQVPLSMENRSMVYAKRGVIRSRKKLFSLALEDLNAALPTLKAENKAWVLSERGSVYNELKRYDAAISDFNQVLSADGVAEADFNRAKIGRGISLFFTKAYSRAALDFSDAIRNSTQPNAIVVYLRGLSWRGVKDEKSAARDIEWAVRLDKDIESKMRGYGVIK